MYVYSSFIHNHQKKKTTQMYINCEWINKPWYSRMMDYYSATKGNELLIHTATWMNVKNMRLGERNQNHKASSCMNPFILHPGKGNTIVTENRSVVARG